MNSANDTRVFQMKIGVCIATVAVLFGLASKCSGQSIDSLHRNILELRQADQEIQLNLNKAHRQFRDGTILSAAGGVATVLGLIIYNSDKDGPNEPNPNLIYVGGILTTAGLIIQIDSHKYIGRAGRRKRK